MMVKMENMMVSILYCDPETLAGIQHFLTIFRQFLKKKKSDQKLMRYDGKNKNDLKL